MFQITASPIDPPSLQAMLRLPEAGGFTAFEGWVRNHHQGRAVLRLEYEAFIPLAEKEGEAILQLACQKFEVLAARCVHRVGILEVGEVAVWVGVAAAHRDAAFAASRFIIDEVKRRVPIWKKEYYADGEAGWVGCSCQPHTGSRQGGAGAVPS
jgi:molybdopterin synthase catalytic subunit